MSPRGEVRAGQTLFQQALIMSRSVDLFGLVVRPVPAEILNKVACTNCKECPARWDLGKLSYACSFCLLYRIDVLRQQRSKLDGLIREVEKVRGVIFARDKAGCLSEEADWDRIAFAIVASNKA